MVVSSIEGTRPILVEVQALVSPTHVRHAPPHGNRRRSERVALLIAVLEKRVGIHLLGQDVFVNVVGGVRIDEPAADLGLIAAVASASRTCRYPRTLVIGEVGLGGEVRAIGQAEMRASRRRSWASSAASYPRRTSRRCTR